jgi:hypothetical protein
MQTVDSNQEQLPGPTIIARSVEQMPPEAKPDAPLQAILLGIAQETVSKDADMVQIGNTVFVGHRGKGKNKDKMVGHAYNIDTGRNFIRNGFKYFTHLQNIGIKEYVTEFYGDVFTNAFRAFWRRAKMQDTKMLIAKHKHDPNKRIVLIKLGEEPLNWEP